MQIRLATVVRTDSDVVLVNVTPGWEDLLTRPVRAADGALVYPAKEPAQALELLTGFYTSEYVFATPPHDESDCVFRHGPVLAMRAMPVEHPVHRAWAAAARGRLKRIR